MNLEGIWTTGFVQDVTSEWEIRAMPTFLFIKDGKQIDKIVGANKDELEKKVQYYASLSKSLSTAWPQEDGCVQMLCCWKESFCLGSWGEDYRYILRVLCFVSKYSDY